MIENSFKAPLNLSPLKCTYLGKKSFHNNDISAKSEKMKLKSGHLELHFSVNKLSGFVHKTKKLLVRSTSVGGAAVV